jgi:hypothetical protein
MLLYIFPSLLSWPGESFDPFEAILFWRAVSITLCSFGIIILSLHLNYWYSGELVSCIVCSVEYHGGWNALTFRALILWTPVLCHFGILHFLCYHYIIFLICDLVLFMYFCTLNSVCVCESKPQPAPFN